MVDDKHPKSPAPDKRAKARADRLAEALRANLKRRKAQARAQADEPGPIDLDRPPDEKNR